MVTHLLIITFTSRYSANLIYRHPYDVGYSARSIIRRTEIEMVQWHAKQMIVLRKKCSRAARQDTKGMAPGRDLLGEMGFVTRTD